MKRPGLTLLHHSVHVITLISSLVHLQEGQFKARYTINCTECHSLIAVMLGTLQMDIQTCIDEYLKMAPDIFPVEAIGGSKIGQLFTVARGRQRFQAKPLELAIKRLVKKHLGDRCIQGEDTPFRFKASTLQGDQACKV